MLHRQLATDPATPDRGDTLVEIIIALAIISLTVVALLGALVTSLATAGVHRSLTNLDTVLRSNAEEAKYLIELQPSAWFQDGASWTSTTYNGNAIPFSTPSGYTVVIASIAYWDIATGQFDPTYTVPEDTTGYQLLTLKATAQSGVSETLSIGLRSAT